MKLIPEELTESREHTDASLGAERANTDCTLERASASAQRVQDDLLERDRLLANERLLRFRDRVDSLKWSTHSASPATNAAVALERRVADEGTRAGRENTDALIERERHRTTDVVSERRAQECHGTQLEAHRSDTDNQLSRERTNADSAVAELGDAQSALAQVRGSQSRRDDVLAMVTHDLRSRLSIITMTVENLAGITTDPTALEGFEEVVRAAARMEHLLTDLLDVARIDSGTLRISKSQQDVSVLFEEIRHSYRPLFEKRQMAFSVEVSGEPLVAAFDRDRIMQVLSNLLGNAMKFTPSGGTVRLRAIRREGVIEFAVQNSGAGVGPNDLVGIFEPFSQIDSDHRRGLGLGLHICQKIVEAHGGGIWAESELGDSATFRFRLPAWQLTTEWAVAIEIKTVRWVQDGFVHFICPEGGTH